MTTQRRSFDITPSHSAASASSLGKKSLKLSVAKGIRNLFSPTERNDNIVTAATAYHLVR